MKLTTLILALSTATILFGSCRAKKLAAAPPSAEVTEVEKPAAAAPVEEKEVEVAPKPASETMPKFNYNMMQFEFNSAVLKTSSYPLLDQIGSEMKKYETVKFNINGYASREGTDQRNMTLSIDRANAVKAYLTNMGVDGSNLTSVGYGETKPVASNDNEEGRMLNRRVEIEKTN